MNYYSLKAQCGRSDYESSLFCHYDVECNSWLPAHFKNNVARSVVELHININNKYYYCSGTLMVQRGVNANDLKTFLINFK